MDSAARTVRLRRGLTAAAVSTLLALVFHLLAGGAMPGVVGIAAPLALTSLVGMSAGGRRPRLLGLLATTTAAQGLFHLLFSFDASVGGVGHAGHGAAAAGSMADHAAMSAGHAAMTSGQGWMWQAHLIAAVLTAVTLHRGELMVTWLRCVLTTLASHLSPVVLFPSTVVAARTVQPAAAVVVRSVATWVVQSAPRRGPPMPVCT